MIKAVIFDLDGTLVQTEVLKARSYAEAINILTNDAVAVQTVLDSFSKYVGLSRTEVVNGLTKEFGAQLQSDFNDNKPEVMKDRVLSKRLSLYHDMIENAKLLSQHFCPYNLGLLHKLHGDEFTLVLATMSNLREADKILKVMGIKDKFKFILTKDNVNVGKPNPEIYIKARDLLQIESNECLVIEDSVNGIKAALNAEMNVFSVTNDITRMSVHASDLLPQRKVIDNLEELESSIYGYIHESLINNN
ncbi:HAD family phosphatase [Flagellimonas sp. CMM7]|uniref:HAD family hydrolase n=1 Tax=Flagellimonas sp. CMM7 TaxID=2654676 RepID=UPI0013D0B87B|nr:HAD family phosphatase [Flagellimonas sp. CMM7]UII80298.1 HAD family phosphatase [Flagellimonas sp. CMM7]